MIYVSTACHGSRDVADVILQLMGKGIRHIELSGGGGSPRNWGDLLLDLKRKEDLEFLCHNYFPPPENDFVINLASLDDEIYARSIEHVKRSLRLSQELGAAKFGVHAGFYFDPPVKEMGKKMTIRGIADKNLARRRFVDAVLQITDECKDVQLYIENNVLTSANFETFNRENPFMLCTSAEFQELRRELEFMLLLDVGHLKVTSRTLGLDFVNELRLLFGSTDYIHLSDNDGLVDQNRAVRENSFLWTVLEDFSLRDKTVTLEIRENIELVCECLALLESKHGAWPL